MLIISLSCFGFFLKAAIKSAKGKLERDALPVLRYVRVWPMIHVIVMFGCRHLFIFGLLQIAVGCECVLLGTLVCLWMFVIYTWLSHTTFPFL